MDDRIERARWMVRAILGAMVIAGIATLVGCESTPTQPTAAPVSDRATHAGVTMRTTWAAPGSELSTVAVHGQTVGTDDGGIAWLCRTQPRQYVSVEGRTETVIDWYVQPSECPVEPIE